VTILWLLSNWKWLLGAAATATLAILLTITTIDRNQWRAAARKADATLAQIEVAEKQATIAAQAAHDAQEQQSKDYARVQQELRDARSKPVSDATDGYAAANRVPVCPAAGSAARPAPTTSKDSSASVPASVPADPLVAISDVDLHKCAALAVYGVSAHDWAAGLNSPSISGVR
jgi:hypothetical protein